MVGRERPARRRPRRVAPGRAGARRSSDLRVADDRGHEAVKGRELRSPSGRDPRASPAWRATARRSSSRRSRASASRRAGPSRSAASDVTGSGPRELQRRGHVVRPGRPPPLRARPDVPARGQPRPDPVRRGAVSFAGSSGTTTAIAGWAKRAIAEYDIRTPSATRHAPDAVRRQSAEGDRRPGVQPRASTRWCSTSRPAASTSAASSSSTARSIAKRDEGAAILLVSAELDEVLELSDRIAVMYRGEIVALVDGPTAEREEIGLLMAAGRRRSRRRDGGRRRRRRSAVPGLMRFLRRAWALAAVPTVSILLALLLGSLLIIASSLATEGSLNLLLPLVAYESLLQGATGLSFIDVTAARSRSPFPSTRSRRSGADEHPGRGGPLILTGLAVGVGFKAGLFNIGGTGQVLVGGFVAGLVGAHGRPAAGARRGDGRDPRRRCLAARSTASSPASSRRSPAPTRSSRRSCSTRIAAFVIVGLVNDVFKIAGPSFARTADVGNAALPILFGRNGNLGIFIALALVADRSTSCSTGRRSASRSGPSGANPSAARYAGMSPRRLIVLTMTPVRAVRRPGRGVRDPRPRLLPGGLRDDDRLRRDHGRPARAGPPGRHPARGAPPRRRCAPARR